MRFIKITIRKVIFATILLSISVAILIYYFYPTKLELYDCENTTLADACFRCTKRIPNEEVDFLVDLKDAKVLKRSYANIKGKEISFGATVLEHCKVFDSKNWDCTDSYMLGRTYVRNVAQMTNGVFTSYGYWDNEIQKGIQCAK